MTAPENMTSLEMAYRMLHVGVLILLVCLLFLCLLRAVRGPRVADRIVAVNMMGTMVMVIIAIMSQVLQEGYLVDICLIYAMISFLAVIVLTKVYMGVYRQQKEGGESTEVGEAVEGGESFEAGKAVEGGESFEAGKAVEGGESTEAGEAVEGGKSCVR